MELRAFVSGLGFRGQGNLGCAIRKIWAGIRHVLKGSWDLVSRVIIRVSILIIPVKGLITLLTGSRGFRV